VNQNSVLQIDSLEFGYSKDRVIYKDFNLEIFRGEIVSILGESGSGKSTLFELISGELTPNKGTINSHKIASIYQDPYTSFHPSYTIIEQIKDVVTTIDEDEINKNLKELNLSKDIINRYPKSLSGGQLQRCSILRALLMKPDLLLADEPTSALDNLVQLDVMKLLVSLVERDLAILLITHDEDLAKWCSDRVVRLSRE
jgi:peptide/nickel transport system ATP-binding protein